MTFSIDCRDQTTREINRLLREAIAAGHEHIDILEPDARHNLGVALLQPVHVVFDGQRRLLLRRHDGRRRISRFAAAPAGARPSR